MGGSQEPEMGAGAGGGGWFYNEEDEKFLKSLYMVFFFLIGIHSMQG